MAKSKTPFSRWRRNGVLRKDLAATYSRGTYRTTTIGNAVFDGRVREGIGSGHSFMATKKVFELFTTEAQRAQSGRKTCLVLLRVLCGSMVI